MILIMELVIFQIIVLLFSVVLHEVAHGFVADALGDPTARLMGRLTLNPLKHLDLFGSVLLPLMLALIPGGVVFVWAKPVPFDPQRLKNPDRDAAYIALAGPATNFLLAIVFAMLFRAVAGTEGILGVSAGLLQIVVIVNITLGVFNLVPIPPLDGSKLLFALLPERARDVRDVLERYGMMILIFFIFFGFSFLSPIIRFFYMLFLGI